MKFLKSLSLLLCLSIQLAIGQFPVVVGNTGFPVRITNNLPGAIVTDAPIPDSLGWDTVSYPLKFKVVDIYDGPAVGQCNLTPEQLFNLFSSAYSTPVNVYYVNLTGGSNSNNGLSSGAPFLSIWKANEAATAAGTASAVFVQAGEYIRANNLTNGGTVMPTVDMAYIAVGGRVNTGTFDNPTYAVDGTHTNTYSVTIGEVDRVMDRRNRDIEGNYTDLIHVTSAARCNITPGSWFWDGTKLYVNRIDGIAPTLANTRVFRTNSATFKAVAGVNIYMSGFDLEGGNGRGVFNIQRDNVISTKKAAVLKNCSFKYGGGVVNTDVAGAQVASVHGIVALFNCYSAKNTTDSFNAHNDLGSSVKSHFLTVNCTGFNTGGLQQSANNWTIHDDVIGIDIAGNYRYSNGGAIRSIENSKAFFAATYVTGDNGDFHVGGGVRPTAFRTDGNVKYWCFRTKAAQNSGEYGYFTAQTSQIFIRNIWPTASITDGNITTY